MAYRVLVWGLGAMGSGVARNIVKKEELRLVGAVEKDPERIGKDLGEYLGGEKTGRIVYSDIEKAIVETRPDIVVIATNSFVEEVLPKIEAAARHHVDILTIAEEMAFPFVSHPEKSEILENIAWRYGVSILGTGINPGFVLDLLIIAMTGACLKVDRIEARRINDLSPFGKTVMETQGVGTSPEEFRKGIEKGDIVGHIGFQQSIAMIGNALGWEIDRIEESREPIISNTERKTSVAHVKPGMVAGCKHVGRGYCGEKLMIELVHPQQILPETEGVETGDYIDIYGDPEIHLSIKPEIPGGKGTIALATNMIPAVIEAAPGLIEMSELPIPRCLLDEIKEM
ncbi:2,4-diaminopentanoate dehydrogenase [Mesotoga sp.]|jgi:4-hydroxy-tetrahydrodipicolinate reductase|uniref:2,4-diaminopentanoate dehydrogenase n=1 Tax=Mesotoga sp. TaxID=2053577 RepID=UPI0016A4A10C|nr:2,4-diaminopentanoate dehydrogenase [Mesotoga sp.]MDI9367625.1 2,4-diaminopentanoate dehydrogenase [Thermotogota bacterium]NLT46700.1 NADP-binding protein [Thermotogaceae bacterium]MDD3680543.1 2,4-diaminopentanoate dehydrogenase [Mesotoga sp.]MDD4207344.1 2,4-diaminopentanoate dehydrogenase [Mesotoga sp.]MDD5682449.1 2,4-diaminopentanoate dehydrogenase [Mesotoga sp.]